jgi:hypothetical protein
MTPAMFSPTVYYQELMQPGEPCKLFKTLNIYGLKGHCFSMTWSESSNSRLSGICCGYPIHAS